MNERIKRTEAALKPLFDDYGKSFEGATKEQLGVFTDRCREKSVPADAVDQLVEFYGLTNGVPCLDSFDFHRCDDEMVFEQWNTEGTLWLGGRDDSVLRWCNGKFCMGDASNMSFSDEDEFQTLAELIEKTAHLYD